MPTPSAGATTEIVGWAGTDTEASQPTAPNPAHLPGALTHTIARILADVGRVKGEDDSVFGDSGSDQFVGDAVFDAVVVNPNVAVANFGMSKKGRVNLMGGLRYHDKKRINFVIQKGNADVFYEQLEKFNNFLLKEWIEQGNERESFNERSALTAMRSAILFQLTNDRSTRSN